MQILITEKIGKLESTDTMDTRISLTAILHRIYVKLCKSQFVIRHCSVYFEENSCKG